MKYCYTYIVPRQTGKTPSIRGTLVCATPPSIKCQSVEIFSHVTICIDISRKAALQFLNTFILRIHKVYTMKM